MTIEYNSLPVLRYIEHTIIEGSGKPFTFTEQLKRQFDRGVVMLMEEHDMPLEQAEMHMQGYFIKCLINKT